MGKIIESLGEQGVLAFDIDHKIRFVTHYGITEEDIEYCIHKIDSVLTEIF
jgi:threonine aldolase